MKFGEKEKYVATAVVIVVLAFLILLIPAFFVGCPTEGGSDKIESADRSWALAQGHADKYAKANGLSMLDAVLINVVEGCSLEPAVQVFYRGNRKPKIFFADGHHRPAKD